MWIVRCPKKKVPSPSPMTFSRLLSLERCPKQWSLLNSEYTELWNGYGFPQPLNTAAAKGIIVHNALQRIINALAEHGCRSMNDVDAVSVMRDLGGISAVVGMCRNDFLQRSTENPRVAWTLEWLRDRLTAHTGEMKEDVQCLLQHARLSPSLEKANQSGDSAMKLPLPQGVHSEVSLRSSDPPWVGIADLIVLSDSDCEILDFKTGSQKDWHFDQVRTYSLLWWLDSDTNPQRRRATQLVPIRKLGI